MTYATPAADALDFAQSSGYSALQAARIDFPSAPAAYPLAGAATVSASASGVLRVGVVLRGHPAAVSVAATGELAAYYADGDRLDFRQWSSPPYVAGADFPGVINPPIDADTLRLQGVATVSLAASASLRAPFFLGAGAVSLTASGVLTTEYFAGVAMVEVSAYALGLNPDLPLSVGVNSAPIRALYNDAPAKGIRVTASHGIARTPGLEARAMWDAPRPMGAGVVAGHRIARPLSRAAASLWSAAPRLGDAEASASWGALPPLDRSAGIGWPGLIAAVEALDVHSWRILRPTDRELTAAHELADPYGEPYKRIPLYEPPSGINTGFSGTGVGYVVPEPLLFILRPAKPNRRAVATEKCRLVLPWERGTVQDATGVNLPWDPEISRINRDAQIWIANDPPPVEPGGPLDVADKLEYYPMPSVECVRLPDRTPVNLLSARVNTDIDSWCWSCAITPATADDYQLVRPSEEGEPRTLELTINGHVWVFIVEKTGRARRADGTNWEASGRSASALLAAPHAPVSSYTEDNTREAVQLAAAPLTATGWTLTWNAPHWLVPGGTFAYQSLSPIQIIARVAASVGAFIACHPSEKILTISPRYSTSTWAWPPASADRALPDRILLTASERLEPGAAYNAVHCVGGTNGIIFKAIINGTDGSLEAPQVSDPLICQVAAGRERGRAELCRHGTKIAVTATAPLFPEGEAPGLVLPGEVVELGDEGDFALATGVSVRASRTSALAVYQDLALEVPR
jgi:hypothetical protein